MKSIVGIECPNCGNWFTESHIWPETKKRHYSKDNEVEELIKLMGSKVRQRLAKGGTTRGGIQLSLSAAQRILRVLETLK